MVLENCSDFLGVEVPGCHESRCGVVGSLTQGVAVDPEIPPGRRFTGPLGPYLVDVQALTPMVRTMVPLYPPLAKM